MKYYVQHQQDYSRGELLLRAFFGFIYIMIPHGFMIGIFGIGLLFIRFFLFWIILFTGKYPKGMWDYAVKLMRYQLRVSARNSNLADGYPEFGLDGEDQNTKFDIAYTENVSRATMLIRTFFGMLYVGIPHGFVLVFRLIGTLFVQFLAFWIILFTGKYPKGMFDFVVGTGRWIYRIQCYLNFYTPTYPAFTGAVLPGENQGVVDQQFSTNDDILDA